MTDHQDPLREAFSLLASASTADARPSPELEERLMSEATIRSHRSGRRATLTIALCLVAAVGVTTVVAAGGVEAIRNWFATAEVIHPDGTKTEHEVTPDGEVWLGEDYGVMVSSPDQIDDLKGRKITILAAPPEYVKSSGLTAEQEREQLRKQVEPAQQSDDKRE